MSQSLVDSLLFTLGLVPSNVKYQKIKSKLEHIPLSRLSSVLQKYSFRGSDNRIKIIKALKLDNDAHQMIVDNMDQTNTIWDRLRYSGSLITENMFENIEGDYKSDYKMLTGYYSEDFLNRFEYLYERDKALRRLEWDLLKIGQIHHRAELLINNNDKLILSNDNMTLIDIINSSLNDNELLFRSIGKSLVYKVKYDHVDHNLYKAIKTWLNIDPIHCTVILADSLMKSGEYNIHKLTDRFKTRIRSNHKLNKLL